MEKAINVLITLKEKLNSEEWATPHTQKAVILGVMMSIEKLREAGKK